MSNPSTPKLTKRLSWRVALWIVRVLCVALLVFYIYFYFDQERWIFKPNTDPAGGEATEDINHAFEGWLSPPNQVFLSNAEIPQLTRVLLHFQKFNARSEPAKGSILYFHGNKGSLEKCRWQIGGFLDKGYDVWMMDYRTYGSSAGPLSETALVNDARMFYRYLQDNQGVNEEELIIWGSSFGSGIAASVAANNSPKMLVLETPYWSLPDAARRTNPLLRPFLFRYHLPIYQHLEFIDCPVHLIHGDSDEKISHKSSEELKERCNDLKLQVEHYPIKGGKHDLREMDEYLKVEQTILE